MESGSKVADINSTHTHTHTHTICELGEPRAGHGSFIHYYDKSLILVLLLLKCIFLMSRADQTLIQPGKASQTFVQSRANMNYKTHCQFCSFGEEGDTWLTVAHEREWQTDLSISETHKAALIVCLT